MRVDCVIVGGGISGLSAAYELHRQRIPFVLVECAGRFGGLIRTERQDGFVVDAGPDALLTHKPAGIALCRELRVEVCPPRSTRAFVAHRSRLRALPDASVFGIPTDWASFVRSPAFSVVGKARIAAEYLVPPSRIATDGDESIASFIARRFGGEALQRLGDPLLAGIYGGDAARLSMRALFPRFLDFERSDGSVIRGLRRHRSQIAALPTHPFVSIRGGTETLVHALVSSLPPDSLIAGVAVSALERCGDWRVHLSGGRHIDSPSVLLASPPRIIGNLVEHVDTELSGVFGKMKNVPLITVALGYRRDGVHHPLAGSGFVVPKGEHASVNAVTWMSSKWIDRASDYRVLLRASIGGTRNPSVSSWSDADLVLRVREDLHRYTDISATPVFTRVFRMPHAGVQLEVGHMDLIQKAQTHLDALRGLFVSAAGFRGVGIADCVADARAQAAAAATFVRCTGNRHAHVAAP